MIDRKTLRNFMQNFMREYLFYEHIISRAEFCGYMEVYIHGSLNIDKRIALIQMLKEICRDFITCRTLNETHYIIFNIDPVNQDEWDYAMNTIYQEAPNGQQ